jgi:N4-bis(aminopropyl)spermidine synthase
MRDEWGLDFRRVQRTLAALAGGGTVGDLVRRAGVDRHDIEDVLRRVEPWVRRDGERYLLTGADAVPAGDAGAPRPTGPAEGGSERGGLGGDELVAAMADVAAGLPRAVAALDHVSATAATMAGRAAWFAERYALAGATVLCVGDHDLTSVAVALAEPGAEVLVVDVDQPILAYIDRVAALRGLAISTVFGDLRVGLPASLVGRADLAFTDPPYTPEGVGLFLARGLQGLRRSGHERIGLAYGFADRQLARGFRTQAVLHELRLVTEALLPGFNRFDGAEAIGAASDLYVCRPTKWTWPQLERSTVDARIYTRGPAASEAAATVLEQSIVDGVNAALGEGATYVGDGWPGGARSLADLLTGEIRRPAALAVNLTPHYEASLAPALLAAATADHAAVVTQSTLDGPLATLIGAVADVERTNDRIELRRTRPRGVLGYLATHLETKLGNAWRDALIAAAGSRGETLTRNEARALVRDTRIADHALRLRITELPAHVLAAVVEAAAEGVPGPGRCEQEGAGCDPPQGP